MPEYPAQETPKAYEAFLQYCNLGPSRSLAKLAQAMQEVARKEAALEAEFPLNPKKPQKKVIPKLESILSQLKIWSVSHDWQRRVRAFDEERLAEERRAREALIKQVNEEHVRLAKAQADVAIQEIEYLASVHKLTGQAAVTLLKNSTDLWRVALGIPTSVEELTQSIPATEQEGPSNDLDRRIREDPDATRLIALLWERISIQQDGSSSPGGLRSYLDWRQQRESLLAEDGSSQLCGPGIQGSLEDGSSSGSHQLSADGASSQESQAADNNAPS